MEVFDYSEQLRRLEACRAEGFGFGEALAILDQMPLESPAEMSKLYQPTFRDHFGIVVVTAPFMGRYREVAADQAVMACRSAICDYLRQFITPDLHAVVEIGCGVGDMIVSLARDNLGTKTKFYACDLSETALKCVSELANMCRADNIFTERFDIFHPSWLFLERPALFFTCNVLSSMARGDVSAFMHTIPPGRICAFEPCGPQIDNGTLKIWNREIPDPRNQFIWDELKQSAIRDSTKIERAIPDFAGKNKLYSLSLIQINKTK